MNQLRFGPKGELLGLDYTAVEAAARMMRLDDPDGETWDALQAMEAAMLQARAQRLADPGRVH